MFRVGRLTFACACACAIVCGLKSGLGVYDFLDSHLRPVLLKDCGGADEEYQWHCTPHCERLCVLGGDPSLAGCIVSWVWGGHIGIL